MRKQGASARSSWRVPSLMRAVRVRGRHFNGRQPSGLNNQYFDCWISLLLGGGGLMRGIKIPQQDFTLKMQGGLMRKGGVYLRDTMVQVYWSSKCSVVTIEDNHSLVSCKLGFIPQLSLKHDHCCEGNLPNEHDQCNQVISSWHMVHDLVHSTLVVKDVQGCHQRLSSAFDLLLIFLSSLIQTLTLTPPPNSALLAILNMYRKRAIK